MFRTTRIASLVAVAATLWIAPVVPGWAQFGNIFSDPAPRPPGNVPQGGYPAEEEEEVPDLPQGRVLPAPNHLPPAQAVPPPGRVQSQPLQPPPGSTAPPPSQPGVAATPPPPAAAPNGDAGGQKPPARAANAPPTPATLQPGDEVVTEPPARKIVNKKASFSGLDTITGRIINFDADIGETVQFGALRVKTDACYTRPATEAANTDAFVEVDEITLKGEVKRIFSGWMFAASPGLHGVEHPIYDIWLTDCKDPETTLVAGQPEQAGAKPPPPPPQQKRPPPREQPRRRAPTPAPPQPLPPFQQ